MEQNSHEQALQLQKRVTELNTILDSLAEPVIIYGADGLAQRANKAAIHAYGFDPIGLPKEEMTSKIRLCHPDGSEVSPDELPSTRALRGETVSRERYDFINAEGRVFITETSAAPLIIDGAVEGAVIVWYDITELEQKKQEISRNRDELEVRVEQRTAELASANVLLEREVERRERAEEDIRESRRQVLDILESITDGFFALDTLWRFTYINKKAQELLKVKKEYVLFKDIWEQVPDVGQCFYAELHKAVAKKQPCSFGFFCPVYNIWLEVRAYPYESGISVYFTDVTAQKRTEEELKKSEERFRATFELAPVGIAHVGLDYRFIRLNQKFADIVGYTKEELTEKTFVDITYAEDIERDVEQAQQLMEGKIDAYSMEKRYIRKDGSLVWINLTGSVVRSEQGVPQYFIAVVDDISDRKRAEEELCKPQKQ